MKPYIYILSIFGLVSCNGTSSRHYPRYADFPETKALQAEVISLDTALFRYPFRVTVRDRVALVMDLHNADHYFHAFTYPEWKHIVSFGKRGEAPEEMLSAETFQFNSIDSIMGTRCQQNANDTLEYHHQGQLLLAEGAIPTECDGSNRSPCSISNGSVTGNSTGNLIHFD